MPEVRLRYDGLLIRATRAHGGFEVDVIAVAISLLQDIGWPTWSAHMTPRPRLMMLRTPSGHQKTNGIAGRW